MTAFEFVWGAWQVMGTCFVVWFAGYCFRSFWSEDFAREAFLSCADKLHSWLLKARIFGGNNI